MKGFEDLPKPQRRAIDVVREVAAEKECRPFLVGGPVRDILLGRPAIDIDLTLEEGSSTLAGALAQRIEGRVRSFPQFLTYKVTADNFPEIDIATARKERYRQPGALPAITAGRLKDDLVRRDFSINALALDLESGQLHDPTEGERDIRDRLVRVLHDESFVDDPTRIFRAIRLAARLGFEIEPQTAALMKKAIETGTLHTVSKERVWRELFLAMDEENAPVILSMIADQGALETLFGRRLASDLLGRLQMAQLQIARDPQIDRYIVYTGVLLRGDASPIDFEGSGFSQKRARAVIEIANDLPRIREQLRAATAELERFRIYRTVSPETLTALAAEDREEIESIDRFYDFARFQLPLRGNDLEVPAGPHVALALERTREAVFRGEIAPDEARAYARAVAKQIFEESIAS